MGERRNPAKGEAAVKDFLRLLSVFGLLIVGSITVWGQTSSGNIQGTVEDPSGAALGGASVTAKNKNTGVSIAARTTDSGLYSLQNLPPGTYAVTVEAAGMKKYMQDGVTVPSNTTVALDFKLQLGSASETVNVTSDAPQLEAETSDLGVTVQNSLVSN